MCGFDVMLFPGWTPLICASKNGHLPVVEHLVEHKANIEAKNRDGMFFLFPLPQFYIDVCVDADVWCWCDALSR